MYPTAESGRNQAGDPRVKALVREIERVEPCPVCRPPRDHVCRQDCGPDDYCACCLGECGCPPSPGLWWCYHQRQRAAKIDLDLFARLLLLADPAAYADRPAPTDVILTPDREARIELMRLRVRRGEAALAAGSVDAAGLERLGRLLHRRRNGSDYAGAVACESEVRHAG